MSYDIFAQANVDSVLVLPNHRVFECLLSSAESVLVADVTKDSQFWRTANNERLY